MIVIIAKVIATLITALAFIFTQGIFFQSKFKDHRLVYFLTGAVALVSAYLLVEQISEKLGYDIKVIHYAKTIEMLKSWKDIANAGIQKVLYGFKSNTKPVDGDTINVFRDCRDCPEMVAIQPGLFTMGSNDSETEGPIHEVTIGKRFALGKFTVTIAEWAACKADGRCGRDRTDDLTPENGNYPVVNVSWDDTQNYIAWLRNKTSKTYRLPSEAEWEYAARAGSKGDYSFAGPISPSKANYHANEDAPAFKVEAFRNRTVAVDTFPPNKFGLHQVHGNVSEWVQDCGTPNYKKAPSDGTADETGDCGIRVIRGGSWADPPSMLRSSHRGFNESTMRTNNRRGFRVARDL